MQRQLHQQGRVVRCEIDVESNVLFHVSTVAQKKILVKR